MEALAAVRRSTSQDPALLADSLVRAFSGRLEWIPAPPYDGCPCDSGCCARCKAKAAHLEYTTGQYFPTEYRKAAATVLETYTALMAQKFARENPPAFRFANMAEVKAANKAVGGHWFDRSTMRFFDTRIEGGLRYGRYFITSEQFTGSSGISEPRKYTVRAARENGDIDTIGEFQAHWTREDASLALMAAMSGGL